MNKTISSKNFVIIIALALVLSTGYLIAINKQKSSMDIQETKIRYTSFKNFDYDRKAKIVVSVIARFGSYNNQRFGCGVVYNDNGYIITNRHIIENLDHAFISVNGKEIKAKVIGSHKELDIAVLNDEPVGTSLTFLTFRRLDVVRS